jgi:hypothetical protein
MEKAAITMDKLKITLDKKLKFIRNAKKSLPGTSNGKDSSTFL